MNVAPVVTMSYSWGGDNHSDSGLATETTETEYDKVRVGADVQVYLDVPSIGGLALKGEADNTEAT